MLTCEQQILTEALQAGRLLAVLPFVAKILEHTNSSKVFKPPNPWTMTLVSLMVEISDMADLRINLKFGLHGIEIVVGDLLVVVLRWCL